MISAEEAYLKSYEVYKSSHLGKVLAQIENCIADACSKGLFNTDVIVSEQLLKEVVVELTNLGYYCKYTQGYIDKMDMTYSIYIEWKRHK